MMCCEARCCVVMEGEELRRGHMCIHSSIYRTGLSVGPMHQMEWYMNCRPELIIHG